MQTKKITLELEASFEAMHSQEQDSLLGDKWPHAINIRLRAGKSDIETGASHAGKDESIFRSWSLEGFGSLQKVLQAVIQAGQLSVLRRHRLCPLANGKKRRERMLTATNEKSSGMSMIGHHMPQIH